MTTENLIENEDIASVFDKRMREFSQETINERAIPSIEDGLLPVGRKIMYTFAMSKLTKFKKAAFFVGGTMAEYHPHGDLSLYDSMLKLSQDFAKLNPLIDKQGNNGNISGDSAAAQRYLELKLSSYAKDVLFDEFDPNYVHMRPNYDGTTFEPMYLASKFPTFLNFNQSAIGIGFTSNFLPHKIDDICEITTRLIKNPDISFNDLINGFYPDLPNGGIIANASGIRSIYENGSGVLISKAVLEKIKYRNRECVVISELAYNTFTSGVIDRLTELSKPASARKKKGGKDKSDDDGKFMPYIEDIVDNSDKKNPVCLTIVPKKDTNIDILMSMIQSEKQVGFSSTPVAHNILYNNKLISKANIKELLSYWLEFRRNFIRRRINHIITTDSEKLFLRQALRKALLNVDTVIKLIRSSKDKKDCVEKLKKSLKIVNKQAEYIAEIRLYILTSSEVSKIEEEIDRLHNAIEENVTVLESDAEVDNIILKDMAYLSKKYTSKRRAVVENSYTPNSEIDERDFIESKDMVVAITTDNTVYTKEVDQIRSFANRGVRGSNFVDTKYNKVVSKTFSLNSHDDVLCFTDKGKMILLKGYELNVWHRPLVVINSNLEGQRIVDLIPIKKDNHQDYLVFVTKTSCMKKIYVEDLLGCRQMKGGLLICKLREGDDLVNVSLAKTENDNVVVTLNDGTCQRLVVGQVGEMLRSAGGYPKISMDEDHYITGMAVTYFDKVDESALLLVSKGGIGKLTPISDIPMRRGDSGRRGSIIVSRLVEGDSHAASIIVDDLEKSIVFNTFKGRSVRIAVDKLPILSRTAKGNRLLKLEKGDNVVGAILSDLDDGKTNEE